jgi:hypothetical protein
VPQRPSFNAGKWTLKQVQGDAALIKDDSASGYSAIEASATTPLSAKCAKKAACRPALQPSARD